MSGMIQKSKIPVKAASIMGADMRKAFIEGKNKLKSGMALVKFKNERGLNKFDGPPLPKPDAGCIYYELKGSSPKKRVVIAYHASSERVMEVYYTENHYEKHSFVRIKQ